MTYIKYNTQIQTFLHKTKSQYFIDFLIQFLKMFSFYHKLTNKIEEKKHKKKIL